VVPVSPLLDQVSSEISAFTAGADPKSLDTRDFAYPQWVYFLSHMPDTLTLDRMAALDQAFDFTRSHNSEIEFAWLMLAVQHHYTPALPALRDFLLGQGRGKFCTPLYRALMQQPGWGPDLAHRIYNEARPGYHAVTRAQVDKVMK
jgi:hypothetical protein